MKKLNSSQSSHQLVPFIILILIAGLIMTNLWLYFWGQKAMAPSKVQPVVTTTGPMADWKRYQNIENDINFSFKYPSDWGEFKSQIHDYRNDSNDVTSGIKFEGWFTNNPTVKITGVSEDYSSQQEITFSDFKGYMVNNGQYYAVLNTSSQNTYSIKQPDFVISSGQIIPVINGFFSDSPIYMPNPDQIGAIANFPDGSRLRGITILNTNQKLISPDIFKLFLSTFKLTEANIPSETYTNTSLGFSINHPVGWIIDDTSTPNKVWFNPVETEAVDSVEFRPNITYDQWLPMQGNDVLKVEQFFIDGHRAARADNAAFDLSEIGIELPTGILQINSNRDIKKLELYKTIRFTEDMGDWQTYKSRNGQFEFNYPAFLTVKTASDVGHFSQPNGQLFKQYWDGIYIDYFNNYTDNPSGDDVSLSIWPTDISADEFQRLYDSDDDPYSSISSQENITFAGHPAILITAGQAIGIDRYYIFPKGIPLVIDYYNGSITKRILSTFKFIK